MDKLPFVCPYCKQSDGFRVETPIRAIEILYFDEFGASIDGDINYTTQYKEKFYCSNCNRGITSAVKKYLQDNKSYKELIIDDDN